MHLRDYRRLAQFVQIAEAGSIRGAARRLGLSPAVVSATLAELEADLGVTLLRRRQRPLAPTAAGRRLHEAAADMVAAGHRAMAAARPSAPPVAGPLAITLAMELSIAWLPAILPEFERRHPKIRLVIHALDTPVDLPRSDIDIALRSSFTLERTAPADTVAFLPLALVAAPAHCRGRVALAERLATVPVVGFTERVGIEALAAIDPAGRRIDVATVSRLVVNNSLVARELAKAGYGAALVVELGAREDLRAGRLAHLDRAHYFGAIAMRILMRDKLPSAPARAFAEYLRGLSRASRSISA